MTDRFVFRNIRPDEADQAIEIERICFPPNEACSPENMIKRVNFATDRFLVAEDRETGKLAGFLNGFATDEEVFRDEFFTDISLYNPKGKNIMLFGLDVLPEYRLKGLATALVREYCEREKEKGSRLIFLTALEDKVNMYKGMGFTDKGIANSSWGGEEWHEMVIEL